MSRKSTRSEAAEGNFLEWLSGAEGKEGGVDDAELHAKISKMEGVHPPLP